MEKKTPFYDIHLAQHGKMVNFHGWTLPLHYGSQIEEHMCVRKDIGLFDVSHMTIVDLLGAGGRQFLRHILSNDVDRLATPGQAMYSLLLNHQGGILDDLIVYFRSPDNYRLILNAATREKDLEWLHKLASGLSFGIQVRSELAMFAVQGPNAIAKSLEVMPPELMDATSTLKPFESVDVGEWFIARTGYTGEDGLEIVAKPAKLKTLWQAFINKGAKACGLGARDSLRIEAGLLLYGQDMDEHNNPHECGLSWTVSKKDPSRDYIGKAALEMYLEEGVKRRFVGLVLDEAGMMRSGQKLSLDGNPIGEVTSGTYSPVLEKSVALARIDAMDAKHCEVNIRNKIIHAKICEPRFVKNGNVIVKEL